MKKVLLFLAICLIPVAVSLGVLVHEQLSRRVIGLHNGQIVVVDRIWEATGDLYYESGKEVRVLSHAAIKSIEPLGFLRALQAAGARWTGYLHTGWSALHRRLTDAPPDRSWLLNSTFWVMIASGVAPALIFCFIRRRRRSAPKKGTPPPAPLPRETDQELPNQVDVVRFFLNLYRQQVGVGPEASADFTHLTAVSPGSNRIYELRVKQGSDWVRRRMTIGPLGEEGSSKSKCYYVIFDKHLVVKIPPKPIRKFEDYVAGIQKERHIVERLAPKECIIPQVSVVLSEIYPLPSESETPAELLEEKYIGWLRKNPDHQTCLKINGTFVYFMDLSRYYFLSHIMNSFRDLDETLRAELNSATELVRHPGKFRDRYGDENEAVGFEIRDLYNQCEADIRQALTRSGKASAATDYRIQSWFASYLEKKEIGGRDIGLSPELVSAVTAILFPRFEKYRESVQVFRRLIRSVARRLSLQQNRLPIAGIITHMLDLLAWLDVQQVAMRDIKPDNLLVAGEAQNYPGFLRSPADYSLGFIDVETAVYFGESEKNGIRQPLLGGTPYYATPSHLFPNSTLDACFGDLPRVLHFQDWQAVLVMIFSAVTGELLFDRTATHFAEIRARVAKAMHQAEALDAALADASRSFWRSAAAEFRDKMKAAEETLRFVEVNLTKQVRTLFVRNLKREIESIHAGIQNRIDTQTSFATPKSRERLRISSSDRICRIMSDLKSKSQASPNSTASLQTGVSLLKELAALKARAESKARLAERLEFGPACRMNAYDLLTLMFSSLLQVMYRRDWNSVGKRSAGTAACPANDKPEMATMVCSPPETANSQERTAVLT